MRDLDTKGVPLTGGTGRAAMETDQPARVAGALLQSLRAQDLIDAGDQLAAYVETLANSGFLARTDSETLSAAVAKWKGARI